MSNPANEPLRVLSDAELDAVNGAFVSELTDVLGKLSRTIGMLILGAAEAIQTTRPCK
jgi:hypothetical protein